MSLARGPYPEYFAQAERVPANLPGDLFHQDLFQFMVFGDPSIQIRQEAGEEVPSAT